MMFDLRAPFEASVENNNKQLFVIVSLKRLQAI